jgi:hypothetical protein
MLFSEFCFLIVVRFILIFLLLFSPVSTVVNLPAIVPQCKPTIQSRFSTLRFMKVVKQFILFRSLLYRSIIWTIFWNYPNTWWFVCIFSNGYSTIHHMVKKSSFNTNRRSYSSPKILLTKCSDFHWALSLLLCIAEIIIDVEQLHAQYLQGRKTIPVKVLVSMLLISCNY